MNLKMENKTIDKENISFKAIMFIKLKKCLLDYHKNHSRFLGCSEMIIHFQHNNIYKGYCTTYTKVGGNK